jgi:hypothetical protein
MSNFSYFHYLNYTPVVSPNKKNTKNDEFREKFTLDNRRNQVVDLRAKHSDRIPIVICSYNTNELANLEKHKFLVLGETLMSQFFNLIRKKFLMLKESEAIYFYVEQTNTLPVLTDTLSQVYEKHKSEDDFLYLVYAKEAVFGAEEPF